jgi:mannobiose 2-epimerase
MQELFTFESELTQELHSILDWWSIHTVDHQHGGFYGKVDNLNNAIDAPKGLVLNARILYTFSSAYLLHHQPKQLALATRAYDYLVDFFHDKDFGGFYWSVTPEGQPLETKKQVYGQAFCIYALAEFYKASNHIAALQLAEQTYLLLELHSYDKIFKGYIEAHNRNWQAIDDLRLSEKDQNDKKSMNTHLHVIEAYANLSAVSTNATLKPAIKKLLLNFKEHIIHSESGHLQLFFDLDWKVKSSLVSYGHDIEAAWLLLEAAELIEDEKSISDFKALAIKMTDAAARGLQKNGGLIYEFDTSNNHSIEEYHWWPQAEAMVGFFNAWQITKNDSYLKKSINTWNFIKQYIKDNVNGEWLWGVDKALNALSSEDKAGFWKCPYHNGRACIELIKRSKQLSE